MSSSLLISLGQHSQAGRKDINQDFHGAFTPKEPALSSKGIAVALADGISSSDVSQIASETAIKSFLTDYYCTSDAWSVKTSAQRVLLSINSWLYAQSQRGEHRLNKDKGYVCTFSGLVIKSTTAHIFHIGDARIYHLSAGNLECLTREHRVWASRDSKDSSYLSRALGIKQQLEIDYQAVPLQQDDIFLLITDGIFEHVNDQELVTLIEQHSDLDQAAEAITNKALANGSQDNLTAQLVKVDQLPKKQADEIYNDLTTLPFLPELKPRMTIDGYEIIRDIYRSSRSHVVLAKDADTGEQVALKVPSVELRTDAAYLERFLMEEWIANRLDSVNILKAPPQTRKRNYLYCVTEFVEGQTLAQRMIDEPKPDLETVRNIIEQIAAGLQCFHRQEMLHQDLRPNNIMIDQSGTVKLIDFGSAYVAGIAEVDSPLSEHAMLGTASFTAPEYFLGEFGTRRSDLYSLGVVAYQMLSGRLPYGPEVAKARTKLAQKNLSYHSVLDNKREIPAWLDSTLRKATHPDPTKRYSELSEFVYDLRHPNSAFMNQSKQPLMERNPLLFWKGLSLLLFVVIVLLCLDRQ